MFLDQTVIKRVPKSSFLCSSIKLETEINFRNAVTFVLVKLATEFKVQNSKKQRLLLLN